MIRILTNIKNKSFYVILSALIFPLTLLSVTDVLITGISITFLFVLLRIKSWSKSSTSRIDELIGFLISLSLYAIAPLLSSIIVTSCLNLKMDSLAQNGLLVVSTMVGLDWLFAIGIAYLIKKKFLKGSFLNSEKKIFTIQLVVFLAFVYLFAEILRKMQVLGTLQNIMVGFLFAQFSFTMFLTYFSFKKNRDRTELENLKEQIAMMNIYTKDIERNYQELQKFRHDYKNLLLALKTTQNTSEINHQYLNKMIEYSYHIIDTNIMRFSDIQNIKIPSIKSLIIAKLSQAKQTGLTITFECLSPINNINFNEVKLIRVLGILLDNAIEASEKSQQKKITVLFIDSPDSLEISIENSYFGNLVDFSAMNKEGYSTKGKNRGLGLSNIQDILNENKQVAFNHYADNDIFVSILTIRKSE
ncbi:sensor histidine kinase [Brochothrix campestris]|uniref:sensor histidine kinase n=1 Tax=Brochothrix campestris TaxID=2757 RepID=UPI0038D1A21C